MWLQQPSPVCMSQFTTSKFRFEVCLLSRVNLWLVWTERSKHLSCPLTGWTSSLPQSVSPLSSKKVWNTTYLPLTVSYLGNQTGHFVAIELIWNTAVDVDRHFALLVALSIRWRDLWLQFFGIFCLEKTGWHKRLQEFSVSDMKKFSPLRL